MTTIKLNFPKPSKVFNKKIFTVLDDYSHFTEVHYGGASSGKSHGVVQKVIKKALMQWERPRRVLFTRKVAATIKDSIFEDVMACLSSFGILEHCKINMTDYRITLPNGAVFLFKGMDNPEKIKSIKGISDIVMEEASEFNLEDYTQLTLRLREKKHKHRQLFLMFNPVSKLNWVYKYFFEPKEALKNVTILHSTFEDNKFLDDSVRENLQNLAARNPAYYRIYALGEFATLDKLIFPSYEKRLLDQTELRHLPSYFGLDFGYINDPSAFIHVKVDEKEKKLYIVEEYVKQGMLNDEIARAIKSLGYSKEVITADSAEQKSIAEIARHDISRIRPARKGKDSVMNGIQFLNQFQIIVDERCFKVTEELENYTWKKDKKTGEYHNEPVDSYNHTIDAIRYAVEGINRKPVANLFKGGL
ncbi:PBSX family phage terminase large subunit [Planococcus sp. X10-3]|uniref:PBSX family phage terminase large subunit n=1 Tax=Planococcus sp. X10-3 TaxID=3061240 RepID=UPI003BAF0A04